MFLIGQQAVSVHQAFIFKLNNHCMYLPWSGPTIILATKTELFVAKLKKKKIIFTVLNKILNHNHELYLNLTLATSVGAELNTIYIQINAFSGDEMRDMSFN